MDLFVYNWEIRSDDPIVVIGHCLHNGSYIRLTIHGCVTMFYTDPPHRDSDEIVDLPTSRCIYRTKKFGRKYSNTLTNKYKAHMAELDYISIFTALYDIDYCGWLRVPSETCHIKDVKKVLSDDMPFPKVLSFDIEADFDDINVFTDPVRNKVRMISMSFSDGKKYILYTGPDVGHLDGIQTMCFREEFDILDGFFEIITKESPDLITGYNIFGFDFKFIITRYARYLRVIPYEVSIKEVEWTSGAYGTNKYSFVKLGRIISIDTLLFFRRFRLENYKLDTVAEEFLGYSKDDISYEFIMDTFSGNNIEDYKKVLKYCMKDSDIVLELFNKFNIWADLCETSKITRIQMEGIYTRGEQVKILNQMVKECITRNVVLVRGPDETWDHYEGGYVIEPKKGIYENCSILDFQSLYPSIIIAYNICPSTHINERNFTHIVKGLFPSSIESLLKNREQVKNILKNETDPIKRIVLDRRQNALKVSANSMYGIMASQNNKYFTSLACASAITGIGREYLIAISQVIPQVFDVDVIYGDTDSCMVVGNVDPEEIARYVTERSIKPMCLKFECICKKIIILSKKRYILFTDGKVKFKGVMVARRGYCKYAKEIYTFITDMINEDLPPRIIKSRVQLKILDLLEGKVDIRELVMTKSVKNPDEYKGNPPQAIMAKRLGSINTRLSYVFCKGGRLQGDKMYTIEEVSRLNLEIDYMYYIEKQVVPQINELLDIVTGETLDSFLQIIKQTF